MDRSKPMTRRTTISAAAVIIAIALCALLPATAAADTSSLTLVASPEVIAYNGSSILTGVLTNTTTSEAVGDRAVIVQGSASGTGPWTNLAVITTVPGTAQYTTGQYTLLVKPVDKTFYQMTFIGDTALDGAVSNVVSVTPHVYLSKPKVPASVRHGHKFAVVSYIQPRHAAGVKNVAKAKFYRYDGKKWVYKMSKWMKTSNYLNFTKLKVRLVIKKTGKWKVRVFAPADSKHAETYSAYSKVFKVK
jgi:hypothetical protein